MHTLAIFQGVGGTGVKVSVSTRQIRSGVVANDLAVHGGGEVFVLELDVGGLSLALADAVQHHLAEVEAAAGLSQHIGRFCP